MAGDPAHSHLAYLTEVELPLSGLSEVTVLTLMRTKG